MSEAGEPVICWNCDKKFLAHDSHEVTCPHCKAVNAIFIEEWNDGEPHEEWLTYKPN